MNAEQNNSSGEEVQSQQTRDLTQLKKHIQLSNIQLLQLTYNDEKFINHLNELNMKGVESILNEEHREALVYFNQCEKILEYAASCGKTMDRSIIVVTLHNQACVNQKLWDLEKSANYLEAIIYNINFYFENIKKQEKQKQQSDNICGHMHKKQLFALYHLQFCAVNSQIRKHSISLSSAKSGIKIMKELCKQSYQLSEKIICNDALQVSQLKKNLLIFQELANMPQELVISDYQKWFAVIKEIMQQKNGKDNTNEQQLKNIKNFSIGKLMQLTPITIQDLQSKFSGKQWVKSQNIINIALYIGVCYFTVGTELRFLSSQNHEEGNQVYKISEQYLISEVYHIFAIMIAMKYVPVRSIFLNHLLTSFNSHYQIDLEKVLANNPPNQLALSRQGNLSNQNSIQLPLIASLPEQSSITGNPNLITPSSNAYININTPSKIENFQLEQKKRAAENKNKNSNIKTKKNSKDEKQVRSNLIDTNYKTERSKSPKFELKNGSKAKKREKKSGEKLKCQTFININRKNQTQRQQISIKNKNSKSKSEYRKSLSKPKKFDQKPCIYTKKNKKDHEAELKNRQDVQRGSFQKKKPKYSKDKMGKLLSPELKPGKSKSKQKLTIRNALGKQLKKIQAMTNFEREDHQEKSKNKNKNKKPQIKMQKVEGIKNYIKNK